ncbi:MAG: DUF2892 domain-containing protein [Nitrospina sp.]|jgi:hypothetical protein|nr:DUF2892 domain-containing protein [Nitrospina sp.]
MTHCNVGLTDRALRVVAGIVLIGYGTYLAGTTGIVMGAVGLIPLITGLIGKCPAYSLLKINTCDTKHLV